MIVNMLSITTLASDMSGRLSPSFFSGNMGDIFIPKQPTVQTQPPEPPLSLADVKIPLDRFEALLEQVGREFDIEFLPDDRERVATVGDLFYVLQERLVEADRMPPSPPGESESDLRVIILEKVKQVLAEASSQTPYEISGHATFHELIPYRHRRQTYERLYRELGQPHIGVSVSRFGCWTMLIGSVAAWVITNIVMAHQGVPGGLSFWASLPVFLFALWLFGKLLTNSCHFPYRTVDDFVQMESAYLAAELRNDELERCLGALLVTFFDIPEEDIQHGIQLRPEQGHVMLTGVVQPCGSCGNGHAGCGGHGHGHGHCGGH